MRSVQPVAGEEPIPITDTTPQYHRLPQQSLENDDDHGDCDNDGDGDGDDDDEYDEYDDDDGDGDDDDDNDDGDGDDNTIVWHQKFSKN